MTTEQYIKKYVLEQIFKENEIKKRKREIEKQDYFKNKYHKLK